MDGLTNQYISGASLHERAYLIKEPTGATAKALLQLMAERNLSVAQIKGCLDYAKFLSDFQGKIPTDR